MNQRLLFLGPPGAGKGTQASLFCKKNSLLHLSTGDLLRAEVAAGTHLGQEAEEIMNKGELVSDSLVLSIVEQRLTTNEKGWLLDGFPRNVQQAESLQVLLEKLQQPIERVVLIEVNDEVLIQRLCSRGRPDDTEAVIRHRLDVYREKTSPLIQHYNKQGLVQSVKGEGDVETVAGRIEKVLC